MIFLVQYLCPERHCIMAMAYDETMTQEGAEEMLNEMLKKLGVNSWCGICGSRDLKYEHRVTRHATMKEAGPALMQSQDANIASRALLDSLGVTHDVKQNTKN